MSLISLANLRIYEINLCKNYNFFLSFFLPECFLYSFNLTVLIKKWDTGRIKRVFNVFKYR